MRPGTGISFVPDESRGVKMIAIITSAHVSFLARLRSRGNRLFQDIYSHRALRRAQYLECLEKFAAYRNYFSRVCLLECSARRVPTYFRQFRWLEVAAADNQADSPNKGVKEFVNLAQWIRAAGIREDERIFKLTGRYILLSDAFIAHCSRSSRDVIAKRDDDLWGTQDKGVHTFMFACRAGIITSFAAWLMEGDRRAAIGTTPIEWILLQYLTAQKVEVDFYDQTMFLHVNYAPPAEAKFV